MQLKVAYSDTRPDVVLHATAGLVVGDTKVKDPIGSEPGKTELRGGHVGMGNTEPGARLEVHGLAQRGRPGCGAFVRATGAGYVAAVPGAYARAEANGAEVVCLLFETFGGFGPGVRDLLHRAAEERGNRLRGSEYDATTWSARTWLSYTTQRMSCALVRAVAWELASAMELTRVRDARD